MIQKEFYYANNQYFNNEMKPFINDLFYFKIFGEPKSIFEMDYETYRMYCYKILTKEQTSNFEQLRQIGENDHYICELIRKDMIEEFIIYINKTDYNLDTEVETSIFETNQLLLKREPTFIEYAAFFGSIQIFNYLYKNQIMLTPSLWIYAIHGNNPEIFMVLEQNKIEPKSYLECLKESIKCHHNEIARYLLDNYIQNDDKLLNYSLRYFNFCFIKKEINPANFLSKFCKYGYYNVVEAIVKKHELILPNDKNCKSLLYLAAKNDNFEIIDFLLKNKICKFDENSFNGCNKLTKIEIPSTSTVIMPSAFEGCTNLFDLKIPSTITMFCKNAFNRCTFLANIVIPPSVVKIDEGVFSECLSLVNIEIPSSVKSIGKYAFYKCVSLETANIHSQITKLEKKVFYDCMSLKEFIIPSSVVSIKEKAFAKCISLTKINIPDSVSSLQDFAFYQCSKISEVKICSKNIKIGKNSFGKCELLAKIPCPAGVDLSQAGIKLDNIGLKIK